MSQGAGGSTRESEPSAVLQERKSAEESDSTWLLWEATMLANALDTHRKTNIRRDFPEFGPWAFSSGPEDEKQQKHELLLFMGLCFRLLHLLGFSMPLLASDDMQAASEAIQSALTKIQAPDSIRAFTILEAPGRQHSLLIYWLLQKLSLSRNAILLVLFSACEPSAAQLAKKSQISFSPPVYVFEECSALKDSSDAIEAKEINATDSSSACNEAAAAAAAAAIPEQISDAELQQAEEQLWSVCAGGAPRGPLACLRLRQQQQQRSMKAKYAEFQSSIRQLRGVLPALAEKARKIIAELKKAADTAAAEAAAGSRLQQQLAATEAAAAETQCMQQQVIAGVSVQFAELEQLLLQREQQQERQQQLAAEIESLEQLLLAAEKRVKETTDSLAAATRLRVSMQPQTSLASFITSLQAEVKQLEVRAAILRHASMQAQPDPAADAAEEAEEIPILD
ncbi:hypothetical protein, conserved [Eimeria brunetti]|uniref:Uncharacterized protein n=1 Tax=Eimeria brunetti TaxID=51314 RepID=U6LC48_9EIME|nr:hypothetical protein, conserved [Eimeria brunetti]